MSLHVGRPLGRSGLLLILTIPLALLPWSGLWSADERPVVPPSPAIERAPPPQFTTGHAAGIGQLTGAGSCAAASCHGTPGGEGKSNLEFRPGTEYSLWVERDPHATAYFALFNERSRHIAKKLGLPAAHEAKVCLACHSTLSSAELESFPDRVNSTSFPDHPNSFADQRLPQLRDGVSCEACHGEAGGWLDAHKEVNWRNRYSPDSLEFVDARKVESRTAACVKCHVGTPGRDVDHDLIAAGHPRLYFEMSAYHARLPHHWSDAADVERNTPLEARLWLAGQFMGADAALALLDHRAKTKPAGSWAAKGTSAPWPEFAELNCFACHHDLAVPSWRRQRQFAETAAANGLPKPNGSNGFADWGTWQFTSLHALIGHPPGQWNREMDRMRELFRRPLPDRDEVASQARLLRTRIQNPAIPFQTGTPIEWEDVVRISDRLADPGNVVVTDWDEATQVYLGLTALNLSRKTAGEIPEPTAQKVFGALRQMLEQLRFPGPAGNHERKFESPGDFGAGSGRLKTLQEFNDHRSSILQENQ